MSNFTRIPDYLAYLGYILSALPQEEERVSSAAGYLIKNNARLILRASPDVVEYVKKAVLIGFTNPAPLVRNAASGAIINLLGILEPKNWPECLQQLVAMLDLTNQEQQEVGAFLDLAAVRRWPAASYA